MTRQIKLLQPLAAAAMLASALAITACSVNPATGKTVLTGAASTTSEARIGREQHPQVLKAFGGAYADPALQAYVNGVGQRLARGAERPGVTYTFTILDTPIVNALATPGGYIYVTRGLLALCNDEAQLAAVLGHEIGHISALHHAQRQTRENLAGLGALALNIAAGGPIARQSQVLALAFLRGFSREEEYEADLLGARYMAQAGYDPAAMVAFLSSLQAHAQLQAQLLGRPAGSPDRFDYLATHPNTADRIRRAIEAAKLQAVKQPTTGRAPYLAAIDGMLYGESAKAGFIRGRKFIHPGLRVSFEVPPGFQLFDTRERVYATGPQNSLIVFDLAGQVAEHSMANYLADVWARGLNLASLEPLRVNGLDAATATARIGTPKGPMDMRLVAIESGSRVFRFRMLTAPARTAAMAGPFGTTVQSFTLMTAQQAAALKPLKIRIVTVKPGESVKSIAARMPPERLREERLRVLNGLKPGQTLVAGAQLKIIGE